MNEIRDLLEPIKRLHTSIRDRVVEECERSSVASLSQVVADDEGDTIFSIDRVSEELLVEFIEREIASSMPVVLIAEGIEGGHIVLPRGDQDRPPICGGLGRPRLELPPCPGRVCRGTA